MVLQQCPYGSNSRERMIICVVFQSIAKRNSNALLAELATISFRRTLYVTADGNSIRIKMELKSLILQLDSDLEMSVGLEVVLG